MIISAHQPAYNPWLGYIHKILISDIFVIMDDVQYEKNSFINRNKILQNNTEIMLTIPIKTKNYKTKSIKDMETLNNNWKIKHLKSIEQSYKKTKNFESIFLEIKDIIHIDSKYLIDYTNSYLLFLVRYLNINTKIVFASDLKIKSKKLDYIIELTQNFDASTFIFGELGKNYVDTKYIKNKKITPFFQKYNHPQYNQISQTFHPNLGIIDLLFNEEKSKIKEIIMRNNIKEI